MLQNPQRVSRRRFIQLIGGASIAALVDRSDWFQPGSVSAATRESRWTFTGSQITGSSIDTGELRPDHPFTAITVAWRSSAEIDDHVVAVAVSTSQDGSAWGDWRALHLDPHAPPEQGGWRHYTPLLGGGDRFRVRVELPEGHEIEEVAITAIDTSLAGERELAQSTPRIDGFIIPRAGWGANEAFRHIDQELKQPLAWPPEYAPVQKIVLHHTVTDFGWSGAAELVRAIYYYHAVTLDWGDIGYNFLIDWDGNVYEGRFGGENVIGGHALAYNRGSIGVALIGDYTSFEPTPASLDSLNRLLRARAGHVDVRVASDWIDWADMPHLCGHGDLMETECPGDDFRALFPSIRGRLAGISPIDFPPPILLQSPKILEFTAGPPIVGLGDVIEIRATVTNEGRDPLPTQGPDPGYTYEEGSDFETDGFPKITGRYRLAVGVAGEEGVPNPYRWGLGEPLAHGEVREIVGHIRMNGMGSKQLTASVVKEFVRYYEETRVPQVVETVNAYVARAPRSADPASLYFDVTGHNVPEPFASYWRNNGDLKRFGYPLTEPFNETSVVDGNTYLTQYFERARFEWHPEFSGTEYEVLLGLLGVERTLDRVTEAPFQQVLPFPDTDEVIYVPETGHTMSYRFLQYWRDNGGLSIFGYPISEKFEEISRTDGELHLVQYFERNRFEYHPQFPEPEKQILLGHLAREILIDREWLPGADLVEDES